MKCKYYVSLIVLILFFSCNDRKASIEDESAFILIPSPKEIKDLQLSRYSEVFDSVRIIRLETKAESLIGRVDKILYNNDHIFILDQVQSKAVFEFDGSGKFIRRFGKNGNGVGEYNEPNDISIIGDELVIWVNDQTKFIIFNLDGTLAREVKTGSTAKSGVMLGENRYALYLDIGKDWKGTEKYNLKMYDRTENLDGVGFESNWEYFSKGGFFFSQNRRKFLISPGYSNTIYEIYPEGNVLSKKYGIDFGKAQIPDGFSDKYKGPMAFHEALAKSGYAYLDHYWETDDCLIYTFVYKRKIYSAYYSKKSKQTKYANTWFNDVNGFFTGVNKGISGNDVVMVFDPSHIESLQNVYKAPPSRIQMDTMAAAANRFYKAISGRDDFVASDFIYTPEEIDVLQSVKSSDNPIVLIQKLKYF
ncbi:6-bladed beta-propeller [Chitinophaga sp. GCM10012297]|uniref:6-bladed beta-propeller n=1 Tax=Chitinophaga chungangae TaxID=2821488 RepID=A0ABS3YBY5_9BACT|nr:6-bladed beta-propeller [Chitinophaga chungangae]MBO9152196.1 6-bladed beta-propeller [Chitinophaga chungangae]